MKIRQRALGVLILSLLAAAPLAAQVRFELGFGWSFINPDFSATYVNSFSPPFTPGAYTSSATQTIVVDGRPAFGVGGFLNVLFGDRFGVQLLADYARPKLKGANTPMDITLSYTSSSPQVYQTSIDWPATGGNYTETVFSLNLVARFPVAPDVAVSVSGGPSAFYLDGKAAPMGFVSYRLEQVDSAYQLYQNSLRMVYQFGSKTTVGFNVGAELAYKFMQSVILAVDLRRFQSASADFPMHIVPDPVLTLPAGEIETILGLGSLRTNPSYFRANIIIRFVF